MSHFYFDIRYERGLEILDEEGDEFPSREAACDGAIDVLKGLLGEVVVSDTPYVIICSVSDADRNAVAEAKLMLTTRIF